MPRLALDLLLPLSVASKWVLEENPQRLYALLVNDSAIVIYLGMGAPAVIGRGIRLNANGGSYEINLMNPWHGRIAAIAASATPDLAIVEW